MTRKNHSFRPQLEALEERTLPSTYYAATASDLIKDITVANRYGGANTIILTAPTTSPYVLTAVNNYKTYGPTVLPVVTNGDNLTILTQNGSANPGYGDTIDASRYGRLFVVASGASLTLENVTLQNGEAWGSGVSAQGGAIYNRGTLVLSDVMIYGNTAQGSDGASAYNTPGSPGNDAAGGGIWSNGALTLQNSTAIEFNSALGGAGGLSGGLFASTEGTGGNAFGGGIYIAGGTANITGGQQCGNNAQGGAGYNTPSNRAGSGYGGGIYVAGGAVTLSAVVLGAGGVDNLPGNTAQGGLLNGVYLGGAGYGGGLYVGGGSVTLRSDSVNFNVAGGPSSRGYGGGIFIASGATVYLDSFTVAHTTNNTDDSGKDGNTANIDGTYILLA